MTARRASFLGLVGVVFAFWIAAIGCALDPSAYSETGDVCTLAIHCDDGNVCTADDCSADGVCTHTPVKDGDYPDGVQGNCKIFKCEEGEATPADFADDVDDGNDCTEDACDASGATHTPTPGAQCQLLSAYGQCDGDGACIVECGQLDADGNEVGCDPAPNECTLSYCDKAKGECVVEELDGVAAPGTTPGECGGTYCIAGAPSTENATANTACTGTSSVNKPKVCSGDGECVDCNTDDQCIPAGKVVSFCFTPHCVNHACENTELDGTFLPAAQQSPTPDCHVLVCAQGNVVNNIDDTDKPDMPDDCTIDNCVAGVITPTNEPNNTPCGAGVTTSCDGMGNCVGCNDALEDCPDPGPCQKATCDMVTKICGTTVDPGDVVNDNSDCTNDVCVGTTPMNNPLAPNTPCGGGTRACDANGQCLGQPCAGAGQCPAGAFCVDGVCCAAACAMVCQACSNAGKGGVGLNGNCENVLSGQDPANAECPGPQVCNGNNGAAACKLPNGQACANGPECLSMLCVDGLCCNGLCNGLCLACNVTGLEGTCSPIPNGQDPASECAGVVQCNGTGACGNLLGNGSPCTMNSECSMGNCVDGYCCNSTCVGACKACNVAGSFGTCTNFMPNTDPGDAECPGVSVACDGFGVCKKVNGQGCAAGTECISGQCQDGVCCNNACGSTCQACNVVGNVGTCTNVPNATDPANECAGVTDCNGAGACTKLTTGTACTQNGECATGACIDNFCCANMCSATCQACSMTKTGQANGTCANVTGNTDPDSECTGTADCNGAGACELLNGSMCLSGSQCVSSFCVDGRCCNSDCLGTCQACNVAGNLGTCSNVPSNSDPAMECAGTADCNGAGACEVALGTACMSGAQCVSGFCVDGVCCSTMTCSGACKSCDQAKTIGGVAGVCDSITANTDPDMECSGTADCSGTAVGCEQADGATCMSGAQCVSGNCVDGFCCDLPCAGTCQACSLALNGVNNGVCANIPPNTDPANECMGAQVCNAAMCVDGPNGTACPVDGNDMNCASGDCVDGVCCSTMNCNGTCKTCNQAFTAGGVPGVCDFISVGLDPQNECALACNGTGACQ